MEATFGNGYKVRTGDTCVQCGAALGLYDLTCVKATGTEAARLITCTVCGQDASERMIVGQFTWKVVDSGVLVTALRVR